MWQSEGSILNTISQKLREFQLLKTNSIEVQFFNLVQTVYHSVKCLRENGRIQFDEHPVIGLDLKVKGGENKSWRQVNLLGCNLRANCGSVQQLQLRRPICICMDGVSLLQFIHFCIFVRNCISFDSQKGCSVCFCWSEEKGKYCS